MKKIILSFALILAVGASSFASGIERNPVEQNFAKQFAGAEFVKWSSVEDLQKATFILAGIRTEAYYNQDGELLGSLRNLFYTQLPLSVMQTLNSKFEGAVVIEIMEISNLEGTSYKIVLEQKDKKYSTRITNTGEVVSKTKIKAAKA